MIDLGLSKMMLIGVVALVVIGPEKLPRISRMVGAFVGKAQRYVSDVKAEVNRTMDLEELRKMKDTVANAARDVEQQVSSAATDFERDWQETTASLGDVNIEPLATPTPEYKNPGKKWRLKRGAVPQWYKSRNGVRMHALSGAARVARHRPKSIGSRP
ncbi:MAG: Sec-independent protein translocase protein TatB [Alphaproteobacteria bacterium]|nr:Sec-independent protein translocase protein TatB [Alphaproteobacteria bacterium]